MAQQPLRRKRLVGDRCYQLFWGAATEVHVIPTPRKQKMSSAASYLVQRLIGTLSNDYGRV